MDLHKDISLSDHSTMNLGGKAAYFTEVSSREELAEAVQWATENALPVITIGVGSNIIWRDQGFPGLVIVNKIMGFEIFELDAENVYLTVGAGENWDSVVQRTVEMGLSGIEQLSLIPGNAGATPVQNVGAYGREIAEVLTTLEVYDTEVKRYITMQADECAFGYRTSRFKTTDKGRFFIASVTLRLTRLKPQPPFYAAVQAYMDQHGVSDITAAAIREAVIAIRTSKLPDPKDIPNNGSFFANPIITGDELKQLRDQFPALPSWPTNDNRFKIPAAWLIETTGFKGMHDDETKMATWDKQPLVLVNEGAASTDDLLKFKQKIVDAVQSQFGITLEQEPELI
jgi:UDP-N-acetylmuramate dehydrogenase